MACRWVVKTGRAADSTEGRNGSAIGQEIVRNTDSGGMPDDCRAGSKQASLPFAPVLESRGGNRRHLELPP